MSAAIFKAWTQLGGRTCIPCPVGKYGNEVGQTACLSCPAGAHLTTASRGSQGLADCVCEQGYFHECASTCVVSPDANFSAHFCKPCPAAMRCEGDPMVVFEENPSDPTFPLRFHQRPKVPEKFMSIGQVTYRCAGNGATCPGASMLDPEDEMCDGGGTGVACALCGRDQELQNGECMDCVGSGHSLVVLFLFLTVAAAMIIWKSLPIEAGEKYTHKTVMRRYQSGVMGVCFSRALAVMQTFWITSKLEINMPRNSVKAALGSAGSVFDLSAFRLGCLNFGSPKSFAVSYTVILNALPFALFTFGGMLALLGTCWPRRREKSRYWPAAMETCSTVLGIFIQSLTRIPPCQGFMKMVKTCRLSDTPLGRWPGELPSSS